jgi:uncharacterized caspase-like protein
MALESPDNQHGIFTSALIRGLHGEADRDDSVVDISELGDFLEDEVPKITKRLYNQEQLPWRETRGQRFPITRKP